MASKWTITDELDLPSTAGVYAIYIDGELVYVGSSSNINHRFSNHGINFCRYSSGIQTPWGHVRDLRIKYRKSDVYGDWAMHELRLIRRTKPRFNSIGVGDRKPGAVDAA